MKGARRDSAYAEPTLNVESLTPDAVTDLLMSRTMWISVLSEIHCAQGSHGNSFQSSDVSSKKRGPTEEGGSIEDEDEDESSESSKATQDTSASQAKEIEQQVDRAIERGNESSPVRFWRR